MFLQNIFQKGVKIRQKENQALYWSAFEEEKKRLRTPSENVSFYSFFAILNFILFFTKSWVMEKIL